MVGYIGWVCWMGQCEELQQTMYGGGRREPRLICSNIVNDTAELRLQVLVVVFVVVAVVCVCVFVSVLVFVSV